jgi:hypothetical protein
MSIFDRYCCPDIHPDDLHAAVNARLSDCLADSTREARNPKKPQEVEQDLFVAWLASDSAMAGWPDWLRQDVINYAAEQGGPRFLVQLGKALTSKRSRWFDTLDIFILTNWRKGHNLRNRKRGEAIEILRKARFDVSPLDEKAKRTRRKVR